MNLVQLLQNIGCKNARNDGMDRISSLRDGRWVEMFAEMGYDKGEFIFPDGRHSSFFLVLPDGNIASADNVMCGNGFYAIANELGIDADAVLGVEPYGEFMMYTDEDGIEDEDTSISIWTPEEFQMKLQQCQQLMGNQINESKNMTKKNTIRLTESELKKVITESVKNILAERIKSEIGMTDDQVMARRNKNYREDRDGIEYQSLHPYTEFGPSYDDLHDFNWFANPEEMELRTASARYRKHKAKQNHR